MTDHTYNRTQAPHDIPQPITPAVMVRAGIVCGFTTRSGGVSLPPFDSLNFGYNTPDDSDAVDENHRIFYRSIDIDEPNAAYMEQVHGTAVQSVESGGIYRETDGLITDRPGIVLTVKCADCIPLLLYDTERRVAAAVHCGWKPIVAGIAENAISLMHDKYKSSPGDIIAALGPAAGPCCYEVGADVADNLNPESVAVRDGSLYADLKRELRAKLIRSGLRDDMIETVPHCTICMESLYYSHRRDGLNSGRIMGYIMMT